MRLWLDRGRSKKDLRVLNESFHKLCFDTASALYSQRRKESCQSQAPAKGKLPWTAWGKVDSKRLQSTRNALHHYKTWNCRLAVQTRSGFDNVPTEFITSAIASVFAVTSTTSNFTTTIPIHTKVANLQLGMVFRGDCSTILVKRNDASDKGAKIGYITTERITARDFTQRYCLAKICGISFPHVAWAMSCCN